MPRQGCVSEELNPHNETPMHLLHLTESDGIYTVKQITPFGDVVSMATRSRQALMRAFQMYARGEVIDRERAIYGTMSKTRAQAKAERVR